MIYRTFILSKKANSNLSSKDKKVLHILEDVVKDISQIYALQLKEGFYPKGFSRKHIEEAAKTDPSILAPFTSVGVENGKLKTTPYHIKYAKHLEPIAQKIEQAAALVTNEKFNKYLKARAKALVDGSYREADIVWLDVKNYPLDFSAGPFERYMDKMFFRKRAYQAHVGVVEKETTDMAEEIKETLYSAAKLSFDRHHSTDIPKKGVTILVEETPATSGYMADVAFSGEHFPCDLDLMKQYGSKVIIYKNQLQLKFETLHYPIFQALFEKRFASKYSKELLFKATAGNILLYELARQLHKFIGARERLRELYGPIDEANGAASGIDHAKNLLVKGIITQDELEAIIIIQIVRLFSDWLTYQQNKGVQSHLLGDAIILNQFLNSGALKESSGISWPNFPKLFFEIEILAEKLTYFLYQGTHQDADRFIKKNANLSNFEKLSKKIRKVRVNI